jgi:hypothetical protein
MSLFALNRELRTRSFRYFEPEVLPISDLPVQSVPLVKEGNAIFLGMVGPTAGRYLIDITSREYPPRSATPRSIFPP